VHVAAPAPPWPPLPAARAAALDPLELRLLWLPAAAPGADDPPRRTRIDALLRSTLAPIVQSATGQLRFGRGTKGRPFLLAEGAPDFNLSDTTGGTLLALSRGARVGVDLELRARRPPAAKLAARYFAPAEARALAALAPDAAARAFILSWTAKEASCKATGTGIFGWLPHWQFEVGIEAPTLVALPEHAGDAARWRFARVAPSAEHTAVVALCDPAPGLWLSAYTAEPANQVRGS
jgi:4'-phosphopantetheinyl transferase